MLRAVTVLPSMALACALLPSPACSMTGPPPRADGGVRLADIAREAGGRLQKQANGVYTIAAPPMTLTFTADSRKLLANGVLVWLNAPARVVRRTPGIDAVDAARTALPLLRASTAARRVPVGRARIVIDPGHGGRDSGAVGAGGLREADIVLDIARRAAACLRGAEFDVRLTRIDDASLALSERSELARRWNADAFVSVHLNAAANPASTGVETFVLAAGGYGPTSGGGASAPATPANVFDGASLLLAYAVHSRLLPVAVSEDRGIRRSRFSVLREAPCPAVLVEYGFLSNAGEAERLRLASQRQQLAEALAAGLRAYVASGAPQGSAVP